MNGEYLVSYGRSGEFGRFKPGSGQTYCRGDQVVVAGPEGLDLGQVLCPVTAGHGRFLSRTALGELLRLADDEDRRTRRRLTEKSQRLFEDARRVAAELRLPWDILDVDVSLDGRRAEVHYLGPREGNPGPFAGQLARLYDLDVHVQNWAEERDAGGCGRPDCGQGAGGCGSCGSGAGCSSCGKSTKKDDVAAMLLGFRQSRERRFLDSLL